MYVYACCVYVHMHMRVRVVCEYTRTLWCGMWRTLCVMYDLCSVRMRMYWRRCGVWVTIAGYVRVLFDLVCACIMRMHI